MLTTIALTRMLLSFPLLSAPFKKTDIFTMALLFGDARVWPLKIVMIGTWWQPLLCRNAVGLQNLLTYAEHCSQALIHKLIHSNVCFKYAHIISISPSCGFMQVTESSHVAVPQTWQPEINESLTWPTVLWKHAMDEGSCASQQQEIDASTFVNS